MTIEIDESQQRVITVDAGTYLVLAPPGCGKTHILTERIRHAHQQGVSYDDMLCLTFTNRAARGMRERIMQNIADEHVSDVYVGNVHRFCSRFLFSNALLSGETIVIDDDDIISIMAQILMEDEALISESYSRRRECMTAMQLSAFMHQIEHKHPRELRIHPECLSTSDIAAMKQICHTEGRDFTAEAMAEIYHNADDYMFTVKGEAYSTASQPMLIGMLRKMSLAHGYAKYKEDNRLIDFEDLLLITYDVLASDTPDEKGARKYKRYLWCQVDEVQDLNSLQLALIKLLMVDAGTPGRALMYLGDEQQAIFSFMGAKVNTLETLKDECAGNILHLERNHRSPRYLLNVFNTYAEKQLGISSDLLPTSDRDDVRTGNELSVIRSQTMDGEYADVAQQAARLTSQHPKDTTAVIVQSNADADIVSRYMDEMGVPHFKVSGTDMFSTDEIKLLMAHLTVMVNEHNPLAWARLLKGLGVYSRSAFARIFVRSLADVALLPSDLMQHDGSSYVMEFAKTYEHDEIVVFDTETTGLNIQEDDILQIAAVKMRDGVVVPGSAFSVYMTTEREIPLMLGDIVNPIIEERKNHTLLTPREGLQQFLDYAEGCVLLGHNAYYDYSIMDANIRRYMPEYAFEEHFPVFFDSLKLVRLLEPQLHSYKLKHLLEVLHLEGENSHLADADVAATCNVVKHLYARAVVMIPRQREMLENRTVREHAADMRRKVLPLLRATQSRLRKRQNPSAEVLMVQEMRNLYAYLVRERIIPEVRNIEYAFRYIGNEMVNGKDDSDLHTQISNHILEMSTLKESDLCSADIIDEKVFISTIHKAKGLEFDNVIVFDAADDRYPAFFSQNDMAAIAEDARKFYVALTRARRRIMVSTSATKFVRGIEQKRSLTRFMWDIEKFFSNTYVER